MSDSCYITFSKNRTFTIELTQEFKIFNIKSNTDFNELALDIFYYQSKNIPIYQKYLKQLKIDPFSIKNIDSIPFLPKGGKW